MNNIVFFLSFFFFMCPSLFTCFFLKIFIFDCAETLLLCTGFLQLLQQGLLSSRGARASQCGGFSPCGARAWLFSGTQDLPRPGIQPVSLALQGRFLTTGPPWKPPFRGSSQRYKGYDWLCLRQTIERPDVPGQLQDWTGQEDQLSPGSHGAGEDSGGEFQEGSAQKRRMRPQHVAYEALASRSQV